MILLQKELPDNYDLVLIGDTHEGTVLRDHLGVEKAIDFTMAKKNRYMAFMGDAIEAIKVDDPRYDPKTCTKKPPLEQADIVVDQFKRCKSRILTWLLGNHEMKIHLFGNLSKYIAEELNVPYGTYSCKLDLKTPSNHIKYFLHHGFGSINSNAKSQLQRKTNMNEALKLKLMFKAGDCKVMAMGHTHKILIYPPTTELFIHSDEDRLYQGYTNEVSPADNFIHPDNRWYVNTGSFLKLYENGVSGYADIAGYNPIELGFVVCEVRDGLLQSIRPEIV